MAECAEEKPDVDDTEESAPSSELKEEDEAGKSSKLDKLLQRLQGNGSAEHSRESSPDPSNKDTGQLNRQSRRKPKVTRKVVEGEDEPTVGAAGSTAEAEMDETDVSLAIQEFLNSADNDPVDGKDVAVKKSEDSGDSKVAVKDKSLDVDADGNVILPEGTVVVHPEAVTDNKPVFKGPEFRSSGNTSAGRKVTAQGEIDLNAVHCSACNHQINTNHANSVKRHPVLKVVLCKRCYTWYTSDEILQDKDGMDEQCRWCGEGGDLLCCDFCHNAFCKSCIRRNLGRGEISRLVNAEEDSKWHCYVCDPKPLAELIYNCDVIIDAIEKQTERSKERERRLEEKKRKQMMIAQRQPQGKQATQNFQGRRSGGQQQSKAGTVFNILSQQGKTNKQGMPSGYIKPAQQKVTAATPGKPSVTQQGGKGQNMFVEWNFHINESNVIPIIDRAMMVTESMHMLLSSLREDIQKAGNSNNASRLSTKLDSASKLKRGLSAFNKSYFDLALFSQKTSGPVTVRKLIEDQQNLKQRYQAQSTKGQVLPTGRNTHQGKPSHQVFQNAGQGQVKPVQLVAHGQPVPVVVPPGANLPKRQQNVPVKQAFPAKTQNLLKANASQVEYIELLDSDDEGKAKSSSKQESAVSKSDEDEDEKSLDVRLKKKSPGLKVTLGGPGHKLKGPLSKRRKFEEQEQAKKAAEDETTKSSGDTKVSTETDASAKDEPKKDEDTQEAEVREIEDENKQEAEVIADSESQERNAAETEPDAPDDTETSANDVPETISQPDENEPDQADGVKTENQEQAMDVDQETGVECENDDSAENKADEVQEGDASIEDVNDQSAEDNSGDADIADFKTIEEQLKQLNGGFTDESFTKVDDLDISLNTGNNSLDDQANIPQLDGIHDDQDSSSDDGTSDTESRHAVNGLGKSLSDEQSLSFMFSSTQDEPVFNLDTLSNSDSDKHDSDEENTDVVYDFGDAGQVGLDGILENNLDDDMDDDNGASGDTNMTASNQASVDKVSGADVNMSVGGAETRSAKSKLLKEDTKLVEPLVVRLKPLSSEQLAGSHGNSSTKRSRADIETQRMLHKSLLDMSDSDDDDEKDEEAVEEEEVDESSDVPSSGEEETKSKKKKNKTYSDDDDYNPAKKAKSAKPERKVDRRKKRGRPAKATGKKDYRCIVGKTKADQESSEELHFSTTSSESEEEEEEEEEAKKPSKSEKKSPVKKGSKRQKTSKSNDKSSESDDNKHSKKSKRKKDTRKQSNSEEETFSSDSQAQVKKNSSQTSVDKSGSDNFDSDLEKDIENLEKKVKLKDKKAKPKKDDSADVDASKKETKEKKKKSVNAVPSNTKTSKNLVEDLSSSEEVDETEDKAESDEASGLDESTNVISQSPDMLENEEEKDAQARKALVATDSSEDSEDSDIEMLNHDKSSKQSKTTSQESKSPSEKDDDEKSDCEVTSRKSRHSLLDAKISDSDDEVIKSTKKRKKVSDSHISDASSSDSDVKTKKKTRKKKKKASSSEAISDSEAEDKEKKKKNKKRKRVKLASDSSADGSGKGSNDEDTPSNKRKQIRKILKDKKLSQTTLSAAKAEEERRKRVEERQKKYNQVVTEDTNSPTKCPVTTKLVLEEDDKSGKALVEINPHLVNKLKPHQVDAVKFMWDCCAETLKQLHKEEGGGCILAHCMGLGKTLSVITFLSSLMKHPKRTKIRTAMVLCPLNTVLNWQSEFDKWLDGDDVMPVWEMSTIKDKYGRNDALKDWQEEGGIMIMGYEMYRNLSSHRNVKKKQIKETYTKCLVDPGPDIIVCDEGHILKNSMSSLSKAVNQIHTRRRIVLTGTPLQNNLVEYHCMVDFVKPNLLGSKKEFTNRFVNPITNGQCSDSTASDVKLMKKRAHILHETLAGCVQRRDYSALTKFLMPKLEYVVLVRLAPKQMELYAKYLERNMQMLMVNGRFQSKGARLFKDYQQLMKIWTHPWALKLDEIRQEQKRMLESDGSSFIDDDDSESEGKFVESSSSDNAAEDSDAEEKSLGTRRTRNSRRDGQGTSQDNNGQDADGSKKIWKTRSRGNLSEEEKDDQPEVVSRDWWGDYVCEEDKYKAELGGKIMVLAEILKMCESIGDKVLVFSQSLLSLDLIEDFLEFWDQESRSKEASEEEDPSATGSYWINGLDYYRMDGSTSAQKRKASTESFNDPDNTRMRLFLISTKAGSLGINLVSANRVIVFDASWNPTHDVQSIFRVYRFGQEKPVYVYRFLAQGTMEEKMYERQVTKISLSLRVVDEHQIERHFTSTDLQELYSFRPDKLDDPNRTERPTPQLPKDRLLAELLTSHKDWIVNYHEHDSLLENLEEETLTEEERKAAWQEYEEEKKGIRRMQPGSHMSNMYAQYTQGQYYSNAPQIGSIVPEAAQIARAIYSSNPGISQEMLQQKVHAYLQARMEQQQMLLMQRQQEQRMRAELMKMQRLSMERYRQQQYLAQLQGQASSDGNYSNLMQQLAGTSSAEPNNEQAEDLEEGEVKLPAGSSLLSLLRKATNS